MKHHNLLFIGCHFVSPPSCWILFRPEEQEEDDHIINNWTAGKVPVKDTELHWNMARLLMYLLCIFSSHPIRLIKALNNMTRLEDLSSLFCTTENYIYVNEEEIFMIYWAKYIHTHRIWEKCGIIHRRLSGVCRWRRKRGKIIYIFIRSTYYLLVFSKHRLIL